jgi:hypothetical protein
MMTLGSDPWSFHVRRKLRFGPHWRTLKLWAAGQDIDDTNTPYYKRLITEKGLSHPKAMVLQRNFARLWQAAPNWRPFPEPRREGRHWKGPICFRIADDGTILMDDGWHRSVISEFLRMPITGEVVFRAEKWRVMRERVLQGHKSDGCLYHPIPHPDFADCRVHHESREEALRPLVMGSRSALDLGTHYGHNLYVLRDLLNSGVGVERHAFTHEVASVVLNRIGMQAVRADVNQYLRTAPKFDIVLAIAILHHLPDLRDAILRIRGITNRLIYTIPSADEAGRNKLPVNAEEDIRRWLNAREVVAFTTEEGRPLKLLEWNS